jgi:predicted transcriptional regulator
MNEHQDDPREQFTNFLPLDRCRDVKVIPDGKGVRLKTTYFIWTKHDRKNVSEAIVRAINVLHAYNIKWNRGLSVKELSELTGANHETLRINLKKLEQIHFVRSYKRKNFNNPHREKVRGRHEVRWTTMGCSEFETPSWFR